MKTLLVGINAKYIHSNLAIRYLQKYVKKSGYIVDIAEFTINQNIDDILWEIYKQKPKILGFSTYLWNIEFIIKLAKAYKKISNETFIVVGGPEVSYDAERLLENESSIDAIICGEGEETFHELLGSLLKQEYKLEEIFGLVFRKEEKIIKNHPREPLSMDELPFVYYNHLEELENKILYYETIRGCPFNCQYCLSSIEKGVRFRNVEIVKKELKFFLEQRVRQVKFVDRTFNCNKKHAMEIWEYLHIHDNGTSNFHFEISADLLDSGIVDFLNKVRPGLFQFEIGIQSTHTDTIKAIKRKTDLKSLWANVGKLKKGNNINLHLDLIAGLPHESYLDFENSFNDVYRLRPEQLQLGFLKVLKGSGMHKDQEVYGIKFRDYAPYEVLCTKDMSYEEIGKLKIIEDMLERYYNSGQFQYTVCYLERFFESPFKMYEQIATFWEDHHFYKMNHSKIGVTTILKDFAFSIEEVDEAFLKDVMKLDYCLGEKVKKFPEWFEFKGERKNEINNFYKNRENIAKYLPQLLEYSSKQISRMAHIEIFNYNMTKFMDSEGKVIDKITTGILFNYHTNGLLRQGSQAFKIIVG